MNRNTWMVTVLVLAALLSGCGGGSGTPSFTVTAMFSHGGSISPTTLTVLRARR